MHCMYCDMPNGTCRHLTVKNKPVALAIAGISQSQLNKTFIKNPQQPVGSVSAHIKDTFGLDYS